MLFLYDPCSIGDRSSARRIAKSVAFFHPRFRPLLSFSEIKFAPIRPLPFFNSQ
jgi:hypothetical protein